MQPKHTTAALLWLLRLIEEGQMKDVPPSEMLDHPFTKAALEYRDPVIRDALIPKLVDFFCSGSEQKFANQHLLEQKSVQPQKKSARQQQEPPQQKFAYLPILLLASLTEELEVPENTVATLVKMTKDRKFKEAKNLKILMSVLNFIGSAKETDLSSNDKRYLLDQIVLKYNSKDSKDLLSFLEMLPTVANLGGYSCLKKENLELTNNDLQKILTKTFCEELPISQVDLFKKHHSRLNEKFRNSNALLIYAGKLNEISKKIDPSLSDAEIKQLRDKMKQLLASVVDALLIDLEDAEKQSFHNMRYSLEGDGKVHARALFSTRPELFEKWKQNKTYSLKDFMEKEGKSQNYSSYYDGWTIAITDDPADLFLCGTETDSCQSVHKSIQNNIALLGYVVDTKIKIGVIKNAENQIIARRILCLGLDRDIDPVLLMEELYYQAAFKGEIHGLLESLIIEFAKELESPLLCNHKEFTSKISMSDWDRVKQEKKYAKGIHSLGCPAPYEYVDSMPTAVGEVTNGTFSIDEIYVY